ncbi:hypothetical protein DRO69_06925 [Candidatus Bathyarchaeota archaeon]|nr:MAG: hypothetical protein DRO69_06925 [Candidatus Bathyarchaeota archaeon]
MRQEAIREALIHFELYRHLMNILSPESRFDGVTYKIEPEVSVQGKSADLVIYTETGGSFSPLLVIEVKKKTKEGFSVFDDDAAKQAQHYADNLLAPYFAITDGERLRFFKTPEQHIGDYRFSLDESGCRQLLQGLAEFNASRSSGLPFPTLPSPMEEFMKKSNKLVKELKKLFDELSVKGLIEKVSVGRVLYLNIKNHRGIIRLGLSDRPSEAFIDMRLKELRRAVGPWFAQVVEELSRVPGFNWVREEVHTSKPNTWRPIKKLITEEPDPAEVVKNLREWILKLEEIITRQHGQQ